MWVFSSVAKVVFFCKHRRDETNVLIKSVDCTQCIERLGLPCLWQYFFQFSLYIFSTSKRLIGVNILILLSWGKKRFPLSRLTQFWKLLLIFSCLDKGKLWTEKIPDCITLLYINVEPLFPHQVFAVFQKVYRTISGPFRMTLVGERKYCWVVPYLSQKAFHINLFSLPASAQTLPDVTQICQNNYFRPI